MHAATHKILISGPNYKKSILCFGVRDQEKVFGKVVGGLKAGFSARKITIPPER